MRLDRDCLPHLQVFLVTGHVDGAAVVVVGALVVVVGALVVVVGALVVVEGTLVVVVVVPQPRSSLLSPQSS